MALPHLRDAPSNFRSPREAAFCSRERSIQARTDLLSRSATEQRRLTAAAEAHDRFVSPESFARSLEAYIDLRTAARKAQALVQRRARLSALLCDERLQQIEALKALQPPPPENVWESLRPPAFFERLYADEATCGRTSRRQPPHLRSTYQAELWDQPLEAVEPDREAIRKELLQQALQRKMEEEAIMERERAEGRKMLQRLAEVQLVAEAREEEERRRRRWEGRADREEGRKRRAEAVATAAAVEEAVGREAEREEARMAMRRQEEKARSERLSREASEGQERARRERERERQKAEAERRAEQQSLEKERRKREEEEEEEKGRRRRDVVERREQWQRQEREKMARKLEERRKEEEEAEEERKAEEAYRKLLVEEMEKMRRRRAPPWATDEN